MMLFIIILLIFKQIFGSFERQSRPRDRIYANYNQFKKHIIQNTINHSESIDRI